MTQGAPSPWKADPSPCAAESYLTSRAPSPIPATQKVPECKVLASAARAGATGSTPSPAPHHTRATHHLCISFKEFIRSKYLHLLQMVNRQQGTESSPWVEKDSEGQPLALPGAEGSFPNCRWLRGTSSWMKALSPPRTSHSRFLLCPR